MKNFEQITTEEIKELDTKATLYRHIPTGAEILSMENSDENKCFGISFRFKAYFLLSIMKTGLYVSETPCLSVKFFV